jgi:hypothetical protein
VPTDDSFKSALYTPTVRAELSQGDIVADIPWGMLEDPPIACYPRGGAWNTSKGKAEYSRPELADQPGNAAAFIKQYRLVIPVQRGPVMVVWQDCEIDKFKNRKKLPPEKWFAGVAPILSGKGFSPELQKWTWDFDVFPFFPLSANAAAGLTDPFHYVDLRQVWPVRQSLLKKRVASLSDVARGALHDQLFTFFSRLRVVRNLACPKCGAKVEPTKQAREAEER